MINLASALTITSVSSTPDEVQPGEKVSLSIEIENKLDIDVTDVVVSLNLNGDVQKNIPAAPFSPYQSSSEIKIGDLDEDDEDTAEFELIADANAELGSYKIPVEISYNDGTAIKNEEGLVSLIVSAEPRLEISADGNNLIKGKNAVLGIKIVNSGLGGAKFLSVKLNEGTGFKIIGSNSVYIGSIDSDDFDTAEFNIFVNENAGIINLPVEIDYTDARNNEKTENMQLTLTTYTQQQAIQLGLIQKSNLPLIIGSVVIVVILFLIYRSLRKRLKKKKLSQE